MLSGQTETSPTSVFEESLRLHRQYFHSGKTRPLNFRLGQLKALRQSIQHAEEQILTALAQDFGKPRFEAYATEVGFVLDEITYMLKHLPEWVKSESVKTPLVHQPGKSEIRSEPLGVSLIIAPWNYPFQLLIAPLLGAIAAGNCAVLKPSELTPATAAVIAKLIQNTFDPHYVSVAMGGIEVNQALLELHFDHIFFTGSTRVGKIVMEKAAQHLTPVTLELGGKSPCIIDRGVPFEITAKRIVWGKFLNAGQTCVAPDYLLVPTETRDDWVQALQNAILDFYGPDPSYSNDYAKIINTSHFERLQALKAKSKVVAGGQSDALSRYMAPTLLAPVCWEDPIMEEEIFGPLLPIVTYDSLEEVISQIQSRPHPLALYLFSENTAHQDLITSRLSFGGGCINDTVVHLATPHLPFGGVGSSGMGAYHGKFSFDCFSHRKSLMQRPLKLDVPLRYPPYPGWKERVVRQIMK